MRDCGARGEKLEMEVGRGKRSEMVTLAMKVTRKDAGESGKE